MNEAMQTLTEALLRTVKRDPDRVAMQIKKEQGYERYTYKEVYQAVQSISDILQQFGIKKGDKIAIVLENRPECLKNYKFSEGHF